MNRLKAEKWLSASLDGELSPRRQRQLDAYVAAHPDFLAARKEWGTIGEAFRRIERVPRQTPEAAWQDVRRAIRLQGASSESNAPVMLWRMKWAGALVASVLALVGTWALWPAAIDRTAYPVAMADRTQVESVETDLPGAMPMVYEDAETGLTVIWVWMQEDEENGHAG